MSQLEQDEVFVRGLLNEAAGRAAVPGSDFLPAVHRRHRRRRAVQAGAAAVAGIVVIVGVVGGATQLAATSRPAVIAPATAPPSAPQSGITAGQALVVQKLGTGSPQGPHTFALAVVDTTTGATVRTLATSTSGTMTGVASPDRSRVYYATGQPPYTLQSVAATGGAPTMLATLDSSPDALAVSPDGMTLAAATHQLSFDATQPTVLDLVATGGGTPHQVMLSTDASWRLLGWAPGGRQLLLTRSSTTGQQPPTDVVAADPATGAMTYQVATLAPEPVRTGVGGCAAGGGGGVSGVGDEILVGTGGCSVGTGTVPAGVDAYAVATGARRVLLTLPAAYDGYIIGSLAPVSGGDLLLTLTHQDCYGPGLRVLVTAGGVARTIPGQMNAC